MSAKQYGAKLLEEVEEQSLEQFLADIRHAARPQPKNVLGVPGLDKLLEIFRFRAQPAGRQPGWPSPTAVSTALGDQVDELNDHEHASTNIDGHEEFAQISKPRLATIELTSRKSASGKTMLLHYLSALSILPRDLGGKESTIVYIDNDGRFSAARLLQMMQHHIQTRPADIPETRVKQTAMEALNHAHIFRPQSSAQLISILDSLPTYLLDRSQHLSIHRSLSLIIIDSATAFYWQDRFDQDMARLESPGVSGGQSKASEIIDRLKALQERFECCVVFSTTPISPPAKRPDGFHPTAASGPTSPFLTPWTSYATLTLTLSRTSVPQFPPQMSLEECLRDADKRFKAVRNTTFVADVDWSANQAARVRGTTGEEGFRFRIGEMGFEAV
ncbi:uncharacterized protein Z518_09757 [Rhinocladiella mackenziei CBS 650.93]|uniref:Rad51-like C-terminal domain-containing protein n=1 Tax=Rhinocladiella mackenziei CBS 650.93 TaxID=1442369 RepID=A0A0D2FFA0_9EURO|nr:uncharacterized protein Z518_09757 [Rhinocladiella mackenziei CBS 650.93]KIX00692.1 hypothetical protein Z518_09757 [Rhinocladiella mackenziei CBS 650.93]